MIPFNKAVYLPSALGYVNDTVFTSKIAGDGKYTKLCSEWMEKRFHAEKVLMTTSCTSALEMTAILLEIGPGDEVIMPSYTFVSTANAFVVRGAKIVFVDIRPDTMNIDENKIEDAITEKTKAIVVVHYAGVGCEMDTIMEIAGKYNIPVVEDAAQGVMSTYRGKALGTIADFGCYSFHETKNYTMGEGGALVINNPQYLERAEIVREKGTNRARFFRGEIDKYTWVDVGSSYLPSEFNVSYLYGQLERADEINDNRLESWQYFYDNLIDLEKTGRIEIEHVPQGCVHNAHMFFIKLKDIEERAKFIKFMRERNVGCVFHYVPLHSAEGGKKYGCFHGEDTYTTLESERLVRLPMFYGLTMEEKECIVKNIHSYCESNVKGC